MTAGMFHFFFNSQVNLESAEMTLHLAMLSAEGLFGKARVEIEFQYELDHFKNAIAVNGHKEVGTTVAKIYAGLLLREIGPDAFSVEAKSPGCRCHKPEEVAA